MTGELFNAAETTAAEAVRVPFLIDRPKRLKIAVTQTKQMTEVISGNNILDSVRRFC